VYYSGIEQYEAEGPVLFMRTDYVPDTAGPGFYRGGAAGVIDSFWTAPAEHRLQAFHVRPQATSRGVNGGESGTFGACWMWDSETSQATRTPAFVPLTLSSPIYRDAAPMLGVLDTQSRELSPRGTYHFKRDLVSASANTMFRLVPNGGAGWGDPLERDPKRVCNDVRDEYVSVAAAARDYGVVVVGDPEKDPEGLRIDQQATERLRAERRASNKGI
jgi:N-methylhydantoinase B